MIDTRYPTSTHRDFEAPEQERSNAFTQDFQDQVHEAQSQLETLRNQQESLKAQKEELEQLHHKQEAFSIGKNELRTALSKSLKEYQDECDRMKRRYELLKRARLAFEGHIATLSEMKPENWSRDELHHELDKALLTMDNIHSEVEEHLELPEEQSLLAPSAQKPRRIGSGEMPLFAQQMLAGLAYSMPLILAGAAAFAAWVALK